MNYSKRRVITNLVMLIILLGGFLWYEFHWKYFVFTLQGAGGVSKTIEESKDRNLYVCSYMSDSTNYFMANKYRILIEDLWVEYLWVYTNDIRHPKLDTLGDPKYQLIIKTNELNSDLANPNLKIQGFGFVRPHRDLFSKFLTPMQLLDTFKFPVVTLKDHDELKIKDTIGWLTFVKKK